MKRLDRRALITSGVASALLAASGVSVQAAPRRGGRLRLAVPAGDGSVLPGMMGAVFDTLTEVAPNGMLRGELATGWHATPDARRWRFALRTDARFHDGIGVGPVDVVASLRRHGLAARTSGDAEVTVDLSRPDPHLPLRLSDPAMAVLPADDPDTALETGLGSGLYRVTELRCGRRLRAERVTDHYKADLAGWCDTLEIAVISDARVRAEALRDGYVDVAALPEPGDLRGRGSFRFHPSAEDMAIAAHPRVGVPRQIGSRTALDDGRIAERWWIAG